MLAPAEWKVCSPAALHCCLNYLSCVYGSSAKPALTHILRAVTGRHSLKHPHYSLRILCPECICSLLESSCICEWSQGLNSAVELPLMSLCALREPKFRQRFLSERRGELIIPQSPPLTSAHKGNLTMEIECHNDEGAEKPFWASI